jgi:hypothetical protein
MGGIRWCDTHAVDLDLLAEHFQNVRTPLRTDFSNDAAWELVVAEVTKEVDFDDGDPDAFRDGGYSYAPNIAVVEDRSLDGASAGAISALWDRGRGVGEVLLADAQSMREAASGDGRTVVYVDLSVTEQVEEEFGDTYGRAFRCVASEVASIEANLSISNMDFSEFADYADDRGGVFRGIDDYGPGG